MLLYVLFAAAIELVKTSGRRGWYKKDGKERGVLRRVFDSTGLEQERQEEI